MCHFRRYADADIKKKIADSGFLIQEISHFVIPAVPFLLLQKFLRRMKKTIFPQRKEVIDTYDMILTPFLNNALIFWLHFEKIIIRMFPIPFGGSIVLVAKKGKRSI